MEIIELDLDGPFDPGDAADLIEALGPGGALHLLAEAHTLTHGVTVHKLLAARWRPWRKRRIRQDQREVCAEIMRRALLVRDVANATVDQ